MSYCINPKCPNPADSANNEAEVCCHCGTEILLQNRYRVVNLLGEGGFARVFEIEDTFVAVGSPPRRKVLKVLLKNYDKNVELFRREADVLSRLKHPGIPRVEMDGYFTFSPASSFRLWHCLVMEYIEGKNLLAWLDEQKQPASQEQALDWLKKLVGILGYLHDREYFHRDIKPKNIMLASDGRLVLIDFGAVRKVSETMLAKLSGEKSEITRLISSGYTPPEQINGKAVPQSDFYALGRTFVHLLSGREPNDFSEDDKGQLLWRESATQISPHLAILIDELMSPLVAWRPKNAEEILQKLERVERAIKEGWPIPSKAGYEIARPKFTIGVKLALAGAILLGIMGLRALSPQIAIALNRQGLEYYEELHWDNAEFYYRLALLFNSDYPVARYNIGLVSDRRQEYDRARKEYQTAIQGGYVKAYNNLGRLEIISENYAAAVAFLEKGIELQQQKRFKNDRLKYSFLKNLGWAEWKSGNYAAAKEHLDEAIALYGKRFQTYCLWAQLLEGEGNPQSAMAHWEKCDNYSRDASLFTPEEKDWLKLARQRLTDKED